MKKLGILSLCVFNFGSVRRSGNRGAVAVEFAIVLFLLILILFGTVEFGWAFFTKAVLTNAAREGARLAVTPTATSDDVIARVDTYLNNCLLTSNRIIEVNPPVTLGPPSSPPSGTAVTVTVTYNYAPLTGYLIHSANWTVSAKSSMRKE